MVLNKCLFLFFPRFADEIKFGIDRLMERITAESEDEDNNNTTYPAKPISVCDSLSNLSVTRTKSRSRSRSRDHSRSRSSSPELEVDSPPPPRILSTTTADFEHSPKKSEAFSVSALLRDDQPKLPKSPLNLYPFQSMR
jgi:growth factor independent 1